MTTQDIRWKQRFQNFERAVLLLESGITEAKSDLEKQGVIQRFEFAFELGWKTLKDYLLFTGVALEETTPRETIKKAFRANILNNADLWIEMLDARNMLSHTYDKETFEKSIALIHSKYGAAVKETYLWFKERT